MKALRMDLCYLCSQHGRQLPEHMTCQDPVDELHWDLLLTAHVMIREEEEPRVGGGCWMWSISVRGAHGPGLKAWAHPGSQSRVHPDSWL